MRISRAIMFMEIAHIVAKRSTCARLNVGAVIAMDNRIRSIGYNGQKAGEPHCAPETCKGFLSPGACPVTHAERNALTWLPDGCRGTHLPKDLYVTNSPCEDCYIYCAAYGVTRIFFSTLYRVNDHLSDGAIKCFRVMPTGYVVDAVTGEVIL